MRTLERALRTFIMNAAGFSIGVLNNTILKNTITVFVYHDVSNDPKEFSILYNLNVPPDIFDFQISFIKNNFNVISPDDLLHSKIPQKAALVTFDDGFQSYFKSAVPLLEKYEIPSILFLNMEPITVKGAIFWSGLITYLCEKEKDFNKYIEDVFPERINKESHFLAYTRKMVDSYITKTGKSFDKEISDFVGKFATEEDLYKASDSPFVFYGNHLFNHDVPLLLSDSEFLESYSKNAIELKRFPNYRDVFSFPYGQPGTCYSEKQVKLLFDNGVKKVFSSSGFINHNVFSLHLERIPLASFHNSPEKIWFQICQKSLRKSLGILN
jgi:hypothetical protein